MLNCSNEAIKALFADGRYFVPHCLIYINNTAIQLDDDIITIDIDEETTDKSDSKPFGNVTANSCTITLDNSELKYSLDNKESPYYKQLVADLKVVISFEVELEDGSFENLLGGTFYTSDWSSESSSLESTLTCYDKLYEIANLPLNYIKPVKNYPIKLAFIDIFKAAGLSDSEYTFDQLPDVKLDIFYIEAETVGKAIRDLANTSCCNVFCTKNDIIKVASIEAISSTDILLDDNMLISTGNNAATDSLYNSVKIDYKRLLTSEIGEVYSGEFNIPTGQFVLQDISFNKCPIINISSIILIGGNGISISDNTYNSKQFAISGYNNGKATKVTVKCYGEYLNTADDSFILNNTSNASNRQLNISIPYIVPTELIKVYAKQLLNAYNNYNGTVSLELRGLPILELCDTIKVSSKATKMETTYYIQSSTLSFTGGLQSKINCFVVNQVSKNKPTYIMPGFYIK